MIVQYLKNASIVGFKGKIIDSHAHIGFHEGQLLTKSDLDTFTKSKLPNKDIIEKFIVSDIDVLHGKLNEYEGNKNTLNLLKNDSNYSLLASCNPIIGCIDNIKKLFGEFKGMFLGLKFHPEIQQKEPSNSMFFPYYKFASENNLPCLFHSQVDLNEKGELSKKINKYSDPRVIYDVARKYPKVPFVMAHLGAGWNEAHDLAIDVLVNSVKNRDANLYADISWVDIGPEWERHTSKEHIIKAIKKLKGIDDSDWIYGDQSFRLMFGSDAPLSRFKHDERLNAVKNYTDFIQDIKNAIRNDSILSKDSKSIIKNLFYENAKKLYLLHKF